jgi:hypothetical protein
MGQKLQEHWIEPPIQIASEMASSVHWFQVGIAKDNRDEKPYLRISIWQKVFRLDNHEAIAAVAKVALRWVELYTPKKETIGVDLWREGFSMTGESGTAEFLGHYPEAKTVREAADAHAAANPQFAKLYKPEHLTYWGCRLYDNEADARKSFG